MWNRLGGYRRTPFTFAQLGLSFISCYHASNPCPNLPNRPSRLPHVRFLLFLPLSVASVISSASSPIIRPSKSGLLRLYPMCALAGSLPPILCLRLVLRSVRCACLLSSSVRFRVRSLKTALGGFVVRVKKTVNGR